jgi:hypothetical protein
VAALDRQAVHPDGQTLLATRRRRAARLVLGKTLVQFLVGMRHARR